MAGRIDEVQLIKIAVVGAVVQAHGVGLDGDAALALQVHGIEDLFHHFALRKRAGDLQQAVGQGGFAVIDVRNDGEIADEFAVHSERELSRLSHTRGLGDRGGEGLDAENGEGLDAETRRRGERGRS